MTLSASNSRPNRFPPASPASGSVFPLGAMPVAVTATDAAGNQSQVTFTVTVRDTTAPVLSQPSDITAEATDGTGAAVSFSLPTPTTILCLAR